MKPIRVAQVMGYMNGGGVESVVMNYYRHIDRNKIQFDFIVCEGSTRVPSGEIEKLGGRVFMVPDYKKVPLYLKSLISLYKAESWRVVHSHMNALSVFSLYAAKRAGVPVRIAHSHSTSGSDGFARNMVKNALRCLSKRYPTNFASCSDKAAKWLFGDDCDYKLFPNGVDAERFRKARESRGLTRSQLGLSEDAFVLGHVGRFAKQKNHDFLIEIFKVLKETTPEAKLLLIGEGPLLNDVSQNVRDHGLAEDVLLLGQRSDVPNLLAAMDVFCLPSLYEGLPVVGIECQATGLPILASSSVTEELKMSSLVEFESLKEGPNVWARHILEIVSCPLEYFPNMDKYDINRCAEALCDYYLGLLST